MTSQPAASDLPPGLIAVPAGEMMYTAAVDAIVTAAIAAPRGSGLIFDQTPTWGETGIAEKRDGIVREFLEEKGLAWLLMIDSDMTPARDLVPRLLTHGPEVGVVAGYCYTRRPPFVAACGTTDKDGVVQYLERGEGGGLKRVGYAGTGGLLVWRHVFEAMPSPWFKSTPGKRGAGEDSNFSSAARKAGFESYVDTDALLGHVGVTVIDDAFVAAYRAGPSFTKDVMKYGLAVDEGGHITWPPIWKLWTDALKAHAARREERLAARLAARRQGSR